MDMNRSFVLKKEERNPQWHVINADGRILGRLSTEIADRLRGKDKPQYTRHDDAGDYIVVINCEKIKLTGDKWKDKMYVRYSGWMRGQKSQSARELFKKDPTELIRKAVRGMLPKNRLSRQIITKLKLYAGDKHPHAAQVQEK